MVGVALVPRGRGRVAQFADVAGNPGREKEPFAAPRPEPFPTGAAVATPRSRGERQLSNRPSRPGLLSIAPSRGQSRAKRR